MGKWMPSLGDQILHYAQVTTHILSNHIVCCGPINSRCSQPTCCMTIPCSPRSHRQSCRTHSPSTSWRASTTHPRKSKARILVTLQLKMGHYIVIIFFMSETDHVTPEYYKTVTMILFTTTLGSRKHWSYYLRGFGGPNLGNFSKNLSRRVTSMLAPKRPTIGHTAFSTRS